MRLSWGIASRSRNPAQGGNAITEIRLAVALTQARIQLVDGKFEQCIATLQRGRREAPGHPVVLDLRQAYLALNDWQEDYCRT